MRTQEPLVMTIARLYKYFCSTVAIIAGATIFIMMFSTTTDTTLRFTLNFPIPGVFELNEVLLVVCVYLGLAWTQIERGHIRVVLILGRLSRKWAVALDMVCWIGCFVFLALLGLQSGKEALSSYQIKEFRWGSVQMPIWWAKALVPIGCWMTCIQLLIDIWEDIARLLGRLPLELAGISRAETSIS